MGTINCKNWDSYSPEILTDAATGQVIGTLQPRTTQRILRASAGVQPWSIPEQDERDQ